jgi:glycosyltransferase involved in cell wall biosynthesis
MNFYYWSPFLSDVATVKAVLNSAISIKKYSRQINPYIINVVGEWNSFENEIKLNKVETISFTKNINLYNNLPRYTFLKSRFSYFLISLISVIKLYKFLSTKKETDYIILHLITSLPLILLLFFNFKCKFVLRISGFPKLTILRKFLWKLSSKKLHKVSTPTKDTMKMLINQNIFQSNMICLVRDPIINISKVNLKIREKIFENLDDTKYIINVGRLTKQKNQEFLIDGFKILKEKFQNLKLIILGEGELKTKLINKSKKMNLQNDIKFLGFKDNVYKYYKRSICFTLTSAWEDPGFVLIEAAASKIPIISSDCKNGPKEFIKSNDNGYLYKNYDLNSFIETFENFMFDLENEKNKINSKIYNAFKEVKNYTKFNHYKELVKII